MPVDIKNVKEILKAQRIETPSWAYGNSGTRFKVFPQPGVARDPYEKIADAAMVNKITGVAPSIALHIPWDKVENYKDLKTFATDQGIQLGAINPNLFQEPEYRLGSICNPEKTTRQKAIDHLLECVEIMNVTDSKILSLWFADGTNYPGQDDIRSRQDRLGEGLAAVYSELQPDQRLLLEYKLYEPAFYTMDVPDWGTSLVHSMSLGENAQVLVDTGHHALATNIEFIVATLMRINRLGGFHFNSRFYGDDDLIVGAADPFQLFRILYEIVASGALDPKSNVAFMLDQCHNIEPKIQGEIRSVLNVQEATAKALLVDQSELETLQRKGDVLGANELFMDAFNTDVRPLLGDIRVEMGLNPDPIAAYRNSGYQTRIENERIGGTQAGWGA